MIQLGGFAAAKEIARLPFGRDAGAHFNHNADLQKRWDTALDPRRALDLVGTSSTSADNVPDIRQWLGELTDEECSFQRRFNEVYAQAAALTTSVPQTLNTDPDFYETLLDTRIIQRHGHVPRRVLDIGPGAGRHLLNVALRPSGASSAYVGVESVGLPYLLQNVVGTAVTLADPSWTCIDQLDHDLGRVDVQPEAMLQPRHLWHVPLWRCDLLPPASFDLIICDYVLDELSAPDFERIVDLVMRCLAVDGVLYCRGGQQRSMFKNLYLFGYGTFHQRDITATLLERGLHVASGELIANVLTRTFVRQPQGGKAAQGPYAETRSDVDLVDRVQRDYVATAADMLQARGARVLIWADPGYEVLGQLLAQHAPKLDVVGVTNEHIMHKGTGPFGMPLIPLGQVASTGADAVLIAAYRARLAVRELREALAPAILGPVRSFNLPFAYAMIESVVAAGAGV